MGAPLWEWYLLVAGLTRMVLAALIFSVVRVLTWRYLG
jgi:hypothetical protein